MVPDNTDVNIRDRRGETPTTSDDQAERAVDRTLIQRIRQAIVADESLSTTAKNVKVMMINGVVTLRGPVHSLQEKGSIAAIAQHIAATNNVDNQLEIKGY
jgi:osmotically-inducible protein OsmY